MGAIEQSRQGNALHAGCGVELYLVVVEHATGAGHGLGGELPATPLPFQHIALGRELGVPDEPVLFFQLRVAALIDGGGPGTLLGDPVPETLLNPRIHLALSLLPAPVS